MPSRILPAAMLVALGCATAPAPATPAPPPPPEVRLEVFEDALAPYGEWMVVAPHGRVWRPLHVGAGWGPYLYGEWVWTADGWFWLSDEPWGWATYHYGRWAYDPVAGWVWVPGFEWAPAWVAWRVGDGYVGWAPLYPTFVVWWVDSYPLVPTHWIFVPTRSFVGVRVERVAVPRDRVAPLLRASRPAPPRSSARPARLAGPARRVVEEQRGRPVKEARMVPVRTPGDARRSVEPGAVPVYRPAPRRERPRPAEAPARPRPAPAPAAPPPRSGEAPPERREASPERAPTAAPATKPRQSPATERRTPRKAPDDRGDERREPGSR